MYVSDYIRHEYFWPTLLTRCSADFLLGEFEKLLDGRMCQDIIANAVGEHDNPVSGRGDI